MPRIKKEVQLKADRAAEKAEKDFYKPKQKREKNSKKEEKTTSGLIKTTWIDDPLEKQGAVFFDGKKYWLTEISQKLDGEGLREASFIGLTSEEWEERIKKKEEK